MSTPLQTEESCFGFGHATEPSPLPAEGSLHLEILHSLVSMYGHRALLQTPRASPPNASRAYLLHSERAAFASNGLRSRFAGGGIMITYNSSIAMIFSVRTGSVVLVSASWH